jgi:anaerobic selenocysteine-containing dehydrogenase
MIVIGGSSMHKGPSGWQAGRAIACLPALTGNLGIPGGGLGPRHGSAAHGQGLNDVTASDRRRPGRYLPNQMARVTEAIGDGRVRVLLLFGTDMLSSFADAGRLEAGLDRADLVVSHDLFWNDTARRFADVVLPSTAWLEELGCKSTNTHLYLMPPVLEPPGEACPGVWVIRELGRRLALPPDFDPWGSTEGSSLSSADTSPCRPCSARVWARMLASWLDTVVSSVLTFSRRWYVPIPTAIKVRSPMMF